MSVAGMSMTSRYISVNQNGTGKWKQLTQSAEQLIPLSHKIKGAVKRGRSPLFKTYPPLLAKERGIKGVRLLNINTTRKRYP